MTALPGKRSVDNALRILVGAGHLSEFDLHFGLATAMAASRASGRQDEHDRDCLAVFAAVVAHASYSKQSACVDFSISGIPEMFPELDDDGDSGAKSEQLRLFRSAVDTLTTALGSDPKTVVARLEAIAETYPSIMHAVADLDEETRFVPLVLHGSRLYIHRFWKYEKELAEGLIRLRASAAQACEDISPEEIRTLCSYFAATRETEQIEGVRLALKHPLSVITGGPGTGKTTMISVILSRILEKNPNVRVALCAPTGKAQARMLEAIRDEVEKSLTCSADVKNRILAIPAGTIHRLLRYSHGTGLFRKNAENPLEIDVLVVDEVSMVSLPLMVRLLRAVPQQAKTILIGDADQLASVETGAVLADICKLAKESRSTWLESVAFLAHNHRFKQGGAIDRLKTKINEGVGDDVIEILLGSDKESVDWTVGGPAHPSLPTQKKTLETLLAKPLEKWAGGCLENGTDASVFEALNRFQILCSHRGGILGVRSLNLAIRRRLGKTGAYDDGVPLMITRNDYEHRLFNGDVGICRKEQQGGGLKVVFPDPDRSGEFRRFSPSVLPEHEDAFAMTVHKAQGSGFGEILMILPDDAESPILTRELIYTGITRARKKVSLWATENTIRSAVNKQITRSSGLAERLARN